MINFKAGDVVRLKSGSPKMTVKESRSDGSVACQWIDRNGRAQADQFLAAMLELFVASKSR